MVSLTGQRVLFIDASGQVWENFTRLCLKLGVSPSRPDVEHFLINSMGFVRLGLGDTHIRLMLRPSLVSGPTLAGLLYVLGENAGKRCSATVLQDAGGIANIILPPAGRCARDLGTLVTSARASKVEVLLRRKLSDVQLSQLPSLLAAVEFWRCGRRQLDQLAFEDLLRDGLGGRFVLFSRAREGGPLRVDRVGTGLPKFAIKTIGAMQGRQRGLHPDPVYDEACNAAYVESIEKWQPLLEDIEARAFWPEHGRIRRRYARLILPFRTTNAIEVLSATFPQLPVVGIDKAV